MIIRRYLTKEVLLAAVAVTSMLLLVLFCQQIVRYLNFAAIGKVPTSILLQLISFEVPYFLAILLPLGLYLGILLAYGRLYADNEMSILQMSGFGHSRVLRLTAHIGLAAMGVVLFLMLWVNPMLSAKRQVLMTSNEVTLHMIQTLMPGRFQASPGGRHVIYVEKLSRDRQRAQHVFWAQEKNSGEEAGNSIWTVVFAHEGYQVQDTQSQDQFFVTTNGYRYEGTPGQNDYKIIQFKKHAVRITQQHPQALHDVAETQSTLQLWKRYDDPKWAAELQWRFSIGIATFLLALLAVFLSEIRKRQGRYIMIFPAVLIYVIYFNLLTIARHWMEHGVVPISIGIWWVHGFMIVSLSVLLVCTARLGGQRHGRNAL